MAGVMELFVSGDEVWYEEGDAFQLLQEGSPMVTLITEKVREFYPQAYNALCKCYAKSSRNITYYHFLIARRFCKCNFGNLDHTKKDIDGDVFNLERVSCPLQGECPYEGVICMPTMESSLSEAEKRVMSLVCEGKSNSDIAEELYLSPNTVKRHISTSYIKTHTHNRAEFVKYASKHSLF